MALTMPRLLALTLVAAALIAVALLPPSPTWWEQERWAPSRSLSRLERLDQRIAAAEQRHRALADSDSLRTALRRRPPLGPALVIEYPFDARERALLSTAWDTLLAALGPGPGDATAVLALHGMSERWWLMRNRYYLPAATDGRTCVAAIPLDRSRDRATIARDARGFLRHTLGPCAYFAAFGQPGSAILAWLRESQLWIALEPSWIEPPATSPDRTPDSPDFAEADVRWLERALWDRFSRATLEETACAAGRLAACRAVTRAEDPILSRTGNALRDLPIVVRRPFWWTRSSVGGEHFLADLIRREGRERFARFWRSPASVDSAFVAVYGVPLEQWTREWIRRQADVRVGPGVRASSVALSLVAVGALLAAAAAWTTRRQVG